MKFKGTIVCRALSRGKNRMGRLLLSSPPLPPTRTPPLPPPPSGASITTQACIYLCYNCNADWPTARYGCTNTAECSPGTAEMGTMLPVLPKNNGKSWRRQTRAIVHTLTDGCTPTTRGPVGKHAAQPHTLGRSRSCSQLHCLLTFALTIAEASTARGIGNFCSDLYTDVSRSLALSLETPN